MSMYDSLKYVGFDEMERENERNSWNKNEVWYIHGYKHMVARGVKAIQRQPRAELFQHFGQTQPRLHTLCATNIALLQVGKMSI